jgi:hypothetical protein
MFCLIEQFDIISSGTIDIFDACDSPSKFASFHSHAVLKNNMYLFILSSGIVNFLGILVMHGSTVYVHIVATM